MPFEHALGVQHPGGNVFGGQVGPSHAEDVGVADRLGALPGAQGVADHAAQARVGAAVGVDRRGVVVGFDLEAHVVVVVEPHDAGVVGKDAHQPVAAQVVRRLEDRLLEQVVDGVASKRDPPAQASCESSARSRSGPAFRARSRSARGRARRNAAGCISSPGGRERAVPTGSGARVRHRSSHESEPRRAEIDNSGRVEAIQGERAPNCHLDSVVGQHALDQAWK